MRRGAELGGGGGGTRAASGVAHVDDLHQLLDIVDRSLLKPDDANVLLPVLCRGVKKRSAVRR